MLTKTEAIVLKSMKYRDTSKIVTFYTKEFGKIKGIAKGARTIKNKFGSSLEPMSYSMLVLYKKENRELHLISQCDTIKMFTNLSNDLDNISAGLEVMEIVDKVTQDEEKNYSMFNLLISTLNALNQKGNQIYLAAFKLQLTKIFGYAPTFDTCGICKKPLNLNIAKKNYGFRLDKGVIYCDNCTEPTRQFYGNNSEYQIISAPVFESLQKMLFTDINEIKVSELEEGIGNEIDNLLRLYLEFHFDGLKNIKTKTYFY